MSAGEGGRTQQATLLCYVDAGGAATIQGFAAALAACLPAGRAVEVRWGGRGYVLADGGGSLSEWLARHAPERRCKGRTQPGQGTLEL